MLSHAKFMSPHVILLHFTCDHNIDAKSHVTFVIILDNNFSTANVHRTS